MHNACMPQRATSAAALDLALIVLRSLRCLDALESCEDISQHGPQRKPKKHVVARCRATHLSSTHPLERVRRQEMVRRRGVHGVEADLNFVQIGSNRLDNDSRAERQGPVESVKLRDSTRPARQHRTKASGDG